MNLAPWACTVRPKRYFDSVFLMRLARRLLEESGVVDAAAVMGTDANKSLLADAGFKAPEVAAAEPDDLVICVRARTEADALAALQQIDMLLAAERPSRVKAPRTLDEALGLHPDLNVVVISVPGEHAAEEARRALALGLHVFCFSSGVPLGEEIELKRHADERRLVMMGPDCGTAIIAGAGLGFANAVRRGPVGIVGPSGSGMQAVTSLVDRLGSGISHAIGTGSRDLTGAVGGVTTLAGLRALGRDPTTEVIVLVAKVAEPHSLQRVRAEIDRCGKRVITCFLGAAETDARTLQEAAETVVAQVLGEPVTIEPPPHIATQLEEERGRLSDDQRFIRGIFAGGSFCVEAQRILQDRGLPTRSNAPLRPEIALDDVRRSVGHTLLDMGTEEFTRGRPHPMIDSRLRRQRLLAESQDPAVGVILLDFVLGYGAAPDPAGDLVDAIVAAQDAARRRGRHLCVVASVCGTDRDPQGLGRQEKTLGDAGVILLPTSALAADAASRLVQMRP